MLPISGADWKMVGHSHVVHYQDRTWKSLCKKLNEVARKNIPTGDPSCPPYVKEAKRIRQQIIKKSEDGTGSPPEDFAFALDNASDEDEDKDNVNEDKKLNTTPTNTHANTDDSDDVSSHCRRPTPITCRSYK